MIGSPPKEEIGFGEQENRVLKGVSPKDSRESNRTNQSGKHSERDFARLVHQINRDLLVHKPWVYWTDFSITATVALTFLLVRVRSPAWSVQQILAIVVAGFAFYRASIFTHEITHMPTGSFRTFRVVWNLFIGIPLMTPTFLYWDHKSHHVNHSYGTSKDGEYFPLGLGPVELVYIYLAHIFLVPAIALIRFIFLAPLSFIHPTSRRFVCQRMSSIATMNPRYRRPLPRGRDRIWWGLQEAGCCLLGWGLLALTFHGLIQWTGWIFVYTIFVVGATLNYARQLGAHRYLGEGEQMLDSTTIPTNPVFGELWAPLGMRYHALHHLLPSLPYHAMGSAHRRLMSCLPEDSPYRMTIRPSLRAAIGDVIRNADKAKPDAPR